MRNKIKDFIEAKGVTVYQFRQMTGIANKTAYDLVNKPEQYPSRDVMDKICSTFQIQPSELLEWVPTEAAADDAQAKVKKAAEKTRTVIISSVQLSSPSEDHLTSEDPKVLTNTDIDVPANFFEQG